MNFLSPIYYHITKNIRDIALVYLLVVQHGILWISEESTTKILSEICARTADDEAKDRLQTLHNTYQKALNGEKITGGPTLADIIVQVSNCKGRNQQEKK